MKLSGDLRKYISFDKAISLISEVAVVEFVTHEKIITIGAN